MGQLHSVEGLRGFSISAKDGELGHVKDVYFDDTEWTVRYLAVDTGGWLTGRNVLISPISIAAIDWGKQTLSANLTKEQVQNSPSIDFAKPVFRQHESEFYNHYGYPYYWTGPYLWGYTLLPGMLDQTPLEDPGRQQTREHLEEERSHKDPHLRSAEEVTGYDIQATDEAIGHVEDLLFDEENWQIGLMVVDTRNWWPGKKVMIPPGLIERVSWEGKCVVVKVAREQIENSAEYEPGRPLLHHGGNHVYRNAGGSR